MNNLLTLNVGEQVITQKVSKWLKNDPVTFDKARLTNNLKTDKEVFDILVSKLRANHFEYFKSALGLDMSIKLPGYSGFVKAIVPYKDDPVEFYKWWSKNQTDVCMTFKERVQLFLKVYELKPNVLLVEHRKK